VPQLIIEKTREMKFGMLRIMVVAAMVAFSLGACNPLNKMAKNAEGVTYTVTPDPLEMHGDTVALVIDGKIPPKFFNKKVIVHVRPFFESEGAVVKSFEPLTLVGENADADGVKINYEEGGKFQYEFKYPYEASMERGFLKADLEGEFKANKKQLYTATVADGTNITPYLVMSDEKPILGKDQFERVTHEVFNSEINYLINSSNVRSSELSDDDMKALFDTIKSKSGDTSYVFVELDVQAYASPDGELTLNENLADNRAKSAGNAVKSKLRKYKVNDGDQSFYNLMGKGEDWDGFKAKMQASDIEDKDLIIRVLQMYDDPVKREAEIKNLSETYLEVKEQILPPLRRSQISLLMDKVGRSDEQIMMAVKNDPSVLSVEEMLYAAALTNDMNEKLNIYQATISHYPEDWRGHNNEGYVYFLQNKIVNAEQSFKNANSKSANNPVIMNNMGIVTRLKGDRRMAMDYYKKASGAGNEVNYNMGIVNIMDGNYNAAVANMSSYQTLNLALAQILDGKNDAAKSTIAASEDKDSAQAYYLKAIIGARTGDQDMVMQNLKMAIQKDGGLKTKAMKDVEFIDSDLSSL
jgi:tetratricopeptide (TPR) repeat protein